MTAASIRARVRAEMIEEIKAAARRHLAADGANLSLRAVARDLGLVSSAIYRYFPSRDELLTALIVDAYDALGEAVERAEAAADRGDLLGRWLAACHAVRDWALANPHEYALIYGSPVPGYQAPRDTVGPATRPPLAIAAIIRDGLATGAIRSPEETLPVDLGPDLARLRDAALGGVPDALITRAVAAWVQLFGAVTFELFGRLDGVIGNRAAFFDHQMRAMAAGMGLPTAPSTPDTPATTNTPGTPDGPGSAGPPGTPDAPGTRGAPADPGAPGRHR